MSNDNNDDNNNNTNERFVTDENMINENDPVQLKSSDEFSSDRGLPLIRFFHSQVKTYLKDPDKRFIMLVNPDTNKDKWVAAFATDPNHIGKVFKELEENAELKSPVETSDPTSDPVDAINTIPIFTVLASNYFTNPETGKKHFPESILNMDNNNWWYSEAEGEKQLKVVFQKIEQVYHIMVDFYDTEHHDYTYRLIYNTTTRGNDNNFIYSYVRDENGNILELSPQRGKDVQIINMPEGGLLTNEIVFEFISPTAGINYMYCISNKLTDTAINSLSTL